MDRTPRQPRPSALRCAALAGCAAALIQGACATAPDVDPYAGVEQSERYVGSDRPEPSGQAADGDASGGDPVVARLGPGAIRLSDLRPVLLEAAGGLALEEVALDRLIQRELEAAGITLSEADIDAELDALFETLRDNAEQDNPEQAGQLLERIRARRGLGEHRLQALLERNAGLRALVEDDVEVTPEDIERAHEVVHGRRLDARIITVPSRSQAQETLQSLDEGEGRLAGRFAELATARSTDASASRGGRIGVVSPADSRLPTAVRESLRTLDAGEHSDILALDSGYGLVMVDRVIEPSGVPLEEARPTLERDLRQRAERNAMRQRARRLITNANIRIRDDHLNWAWERRGN